MNLEANNANNMKVEVEDMEEEEEVVVTAVEEEATKSNGKVDVAEDNTKLSILIIMEEAMEVEVIMVEEADIKIAIIEIKVVVMNLNQTVSPYVMT